MADRANSTRRAFLRAIPATAVLATMPALADAQVPFAREDVARRVHHLAAEMSRLLGDLDGGMWEVRVSPPHCGVENFAVQPVDVSPTVRLEQGLAIAASALNTLRPGKWRKDRNLEMGIVIITNDTWRGEA